jgi:hypothetical protein
MPEAVHATTMEEVSAALWSETSDEIVVEGDPQFLRSVESLVVQWQQQRRRGGLRFSPDLFGPPTFPLWSFYGAITGISVAVAVVGLFVLLFFVQPNISFLTTIIWAIVVLVISYMIFHRVCHAMQKNYDVKFTWTVTKYASGTLVISRNKRGRANRKNNVPAVRK